MDMLVPGETMDFDFKYGLHELSTIVDSLTVVVLVVNEVVKHQFSKNPSVPLDPPCEY